MSIYPLALTLGYDDFPSLTAAQMDEVWGLYQKIKDNDLKILGDVATVQQALANESIYVLLSGESIASPLILDGFPVDWAIPDEGVSMWSEAVGIAKGTKKPELAELMVKYYLSPEGQKELSINPLYWGMPANRDAGELMSAEEKRILRWDNQDEYLADALPYWQPPDDLNEQWETKFFEILAD